MALNDVQMAMQFQVTRLTFPTAASQASTDIVEKYPCGHPKVDTSGLREGVYVETGSTRRSKQEVKLDPDQCPICATTETFKPAKKKFKLGLLFWVLTGTAIFGFVATYVFLSISGV